MRMPLDESVTQDSYEIIKMGNTNTTGLPVYVDITSLKEYLEDTYTVIRSNGAVQRLWSMSPHQCSVYENSQRVTQAVMKDGVWRINMHTGSLVSNHFCGCRPVHEIWPTRLDGDDAEIALWQSALRTKLEAMWVLAIKEQAAAAAIPT